ncbi:MAG: GTP-binding protein TypA [Candidatus Gottesmanbacteria bacterium GW2011_GWC2_42_8]|nr:MAG: GTP-binding protein TypA [Candidatus Gottesmanbacteria bacterium GW2011_GWC2_42_8]
MAGLFFYDLMDIRNIAIIAHVDHGKTTLVDWMLKQTHTFRDNEIEMKQTTILDRNELEREKGITILSKNTAVIYKDTKINIIDTPGHADFSGEVERVINMADGALLIIDAAEGPLPQTQFVLEKAMEQNLKIIVVINKIDRQDARPLQVLKETEELFLRLAKHTYQLEYTVLYAVGREGQAWKELPRNINDQADLSPLFDEILKKIPKPLAHENKPFKMLISTLDFDSYKGTYAITALIKDKDGLKLIAARDSSGNRPLVIGKLGDGFVVASEDSAFELVKATRLMEVGPGTMVVISGETRDHPRVIQIAKQKNIYHCVFEGIYFSYPTSHMFGISLARFRETLGARLAKCFGVHVKENDVVTNVPDSSNYIATGFCREQRTPLQIVFVRRHYRVGGFPESVRSFIQGSDGDRDWNSIR